MNKKQQLQLIWRHTHPDFRGIINDVPSLLVLREGGTTLVRLDCLTDKEIEDKFRSAQRLEARRLTRVLEARRLAKKAESHRDEDRLGFGLEPVEQAP